jgi:hypothetical protein
MALAPEAGDFNQGGLVDDGRAAQQRAGDQYFFLAGEMSDQPAWRVGKPRQSLGEVSASRIVATPGSQTFAHDLFTRMHYGITPELAGMSLALLAGVWLTLSIISLGRLVSRHPT